jgi:hypothetical protein
MNWKDIGTKLAALGLPALGAAIAGPAGMAVGKLIAGSLGLGADATPEQTAAALGNVSGDQIVALKTIEAQMARDKLEHDTKERQADSADLAAINQTMQAEGKSEHWLQWSWRPLNGLSLALGSLLLVVGVLVMAGVAIYNKDFASLNAIPTIVMSVSAALAVPGAVCGVTAWHKGVMQRIQAQNGA